MQEHIPHLLVAQKVASGYAMPMALTVNIREFRKAAGLSQVELGELVGVSHVHVSQVERGLRNLNNHLIQRFARALNVDPSDLISAPGDEDFDRLARAMKQLPPEDRDRVEAFVAALHQARRGQERSE